MVDFDETTAGGGHGGKGGQGGDTTASTGGTDVGGAGGAGGAAPQAIVAKASHSIRLLAAEGDNLAYLEDNTGNLCIVSSTASQQDCSDPTACACNTGNPWDHRGTHLQLLKGNAYYSPAGSSADIPVFRCSKTTCTGLLQPANAIDTTLRGFARTSDAIVAVGPNSGRILTINANQDTFMAGPTIAIGDLAVMGLSFVSILGSEVTVVAPGGTDSPNRCMAMTDLSKLTDPGSMECAALLPGVVAPMRIGNVISVTASQGASHLFAVVFSDHTEYFLGEAQFLPLTVVGEMPFMAADDAAAYLWVPTNGMELTLSRCELATRQCKALSEPFARDELGPIVVDNGRVYFAVGETVYRVVIEG
ncbi:MAG: hypothetical protein U0271_25675 [Polyangiaceae bacterium]